MGFTLSLHCFSSTTAKLSQLFFNCTPFLQVAPSFKYYSIPTLVQRRTMKHRYSIFSQSDSTFFCLPFYLGDMDSYHVSKLKVCWWQLELCLHACENTKSLHMLYKSSLFSYNIWQLERLSQFTLTWLGRRSKCLAASCSSLSYFSPSSHLTWSFKPPSLLLWYFYCCIKSI